jgi:5'-nucleotidase (lipoprotein e(P4) family)
MSIINHSGRKGSQLAWVLLLLCSLTAIAQAPAGANQPQADNEYLTAAVLWQQASGERRALALQAFALARMMLDRDLVMNRRPRKPRAIIVDLDETILDNNRYEGMLLKNRQNYPQGWTDWINRAEATAVPGAVEFLRYAASHRVQVFYITNRKESLKQSTATNLKKLGFPDVNEQTLLMQTDPENSSKEPRRQSIAAKYRIVLLMGDDLNDFAEVFESSKTVAGNVWQLGKRDLRLQFQTHRSRESRTKKEPTALLLKAFDRRSESTVPAINLKSSEMASAATLRTTSGRCEKSHASEELRLRLSLLRPPGP